MVVAVGFLRRFGGLGGGVWLLSSSSKTLLSESFFSPSESLLELPEDVDPERFFFEDEEDFFFDLSDDFEPEEEEHQRFRKYFSRIKSRIFSFSPGRGRALSRPSLYFANHIFATHSASSSANSRG